MKGIILNVLLRFITLNVLVKINKRKAHLKWSQEASRGSAQSPRTLSITDPNRKRYLALPVGSRLYYSSRRSKDFLLAQQQPSQWKTPNSANETPLYLELPVYTKKLFVYDNCSQLSPFLSKGAFLLVVLLTCLWFYYSLCVLNCNFLLFPQINPFCWQTNWQFYF